MPVFSWNRDLCSPEVCFSHAFSPEIQAFQRTRYRFFRSLSNNIAGGNPPQQPHDQKKALMPRRSDMQPPTAPLSLLIHLITLAASCSCYLLLPASASAQPANIRVVSLEAGFQSEGQVGKWLPVRIHAAGLTPGETVNLTIAAPDPAGDRCESLAATNTADHAGNLIVEGVFCSGRLEGNIQFILSSQSGQILWTHEITCSESAATAPGPDNTLPQRLKLCRQTPLITLTIGATAGLPELNDRFAADPATNGLLKTFQLPSIQQLPSQHRGLDSIDVLLLSGPWNLTKLQSEAIREWVLAGGHLALSCGADADALLASPLGKWIQPKFGIPNTTNTLQTLDLTAIQNYVRGATALQTNRNPVTVLRMPSQQPKILVQSLSDPLISRTSAGTGLITLTAVNLNARPLDKWLSLPQLYEMLIFGEPQTGNVEQTRSGGRIASVGITDLSTQLAAVSDALPDAQRWSTWHIMLLITLLLLLVGPLDYLLVVRFLKTPKLTWITLPALIIIGCGFATLALNTKRSEFLVRQTELLDVFTDENQQRLRARSWASLSARQSRYVTAATTNAAWINTATLSDGSRSLMWSGRAEDVYGGMYRPGGAGLGQLVSRRSDIDNSGYSALPLLADGSTALFTDLRSLAHTQQPLFESQLRLPSNALLEGSFKHHLPAKITNWIVACGNRIYSPSDRAEEHIKELEPGEVWSRDTGGIRVVEIRDFLRGVRIAPTTPKNTSTLKTNVSQPQQAWDVSNRNPLDILLMASLYKSAGGKAWVQLRNDALRRDELSDSITLNTAVLIGLMPRQLSDVQADGNPVPPTDSATVVRLFLPIERVSGNLPPAATKEADQLPQP